MSYTPTEWHTGDIVTANKLNNLEQGVVDAQLPEYSPAYKGKVLTLGEQEGEPIVVVPEQTVTLPSGRLSASLSDVPTLDDAPKSINYVLVYMGETFSGVAAKDANLRYQLGEMPLYLSLGHDGIFFLEILEAAPIDLTVTISATISTPLVEPKWEVASPFIISCTGTATASSGELLIPINKTMAEIEEQCFVDASNSDYRFKVPVYLNLPSVNTILTEYNYSDDSFMVLLGSENAILSGDVVFENGTQEYSVEIDSEDAIYISVISK